MPKHRASQYSVLIVDDEPMARTLLRLMLVRSGYEVIEAEDGDAALEKVLTTDPDLIILDLMMPGIDGLDVCKHIRNDHSTTDLPIIILSAKGDLRSAQQALEAGANKFLVKPVAPEELTREVTQILETGE